MEGSIYPMLCNFNKIKILEILSKEVNIKNIRKESKWVNIIELI